jgi:PQQ-like domain
VAVRFRARRPGWSRRPLRRTLRGALLPALCVGLAACGANARARVPTPTVSAAAIPEDATPAATAGRLQSWREFGLDPQRSSVSTLATGITGANVAHLRRVHVHVPGTVDSSPVYLHGASVRGGVHDAIFVTTSYGRTLALDASSGAILWTFTPAGYGSWEGSSQITTTSPLVDPDGRFVYAASPNGLVHKLSISSGAEQPGWPVRVTLDARHEKLAAALNLDGPDLLVATGGYFGDAPPYQGHLVLIGRASARIDGVFNTLCADRRALIHPSSCPASDSAVLSRGGAVVEPGGGRILISTGNGPFNARNDFGDSVLEITFPRLSLRQTFTPTDQARLNATDTDLGSSAPALLGHDRVIVAGKDGILRVLALSGLDGHPAGSAAAQRHPVGGEVQRLSVPGGAELFTAPAVWRNGSSTTVFIADGEGTAAYVLRGGLLLRAWQNGSPGTSPVLAGGLLYVYDPAAGGIRVYAPNSGRPIARLAGDAGHWNSPIVVDGHVIEPEGNANDHSGSGTIDIFSAP